MDMLFQTNDQNRKTENKDRSKRECSGVNFRADSGVNFRAASDSLFAHPHPNGRTLDMQLFPTPPI